MAIRAGDLRHAAADAEVTGLTLNGHAIRRAGESKHELHLARGSIDALLDAHGAAFGEMDVRLLTGLQLSPGSKTDVAGKPVCLYCATAPQHAEEIRKALNSAHWLTDDRHADRILVVLWCTS